MNLYSALQRRSGSSTAPGPGRARRQGVSTDASAHSDREEGSALVWLLLCLPALFALLGLVFDGGAAITGSQEADNVADQAARAGADQLDTGSARADQDRYGPADVSRASSSACTYVAVASPQMTCTATVNADAVVVTVSDSVPAQFLGIIGINALTVHGSGTADSHTGIDEEVQS